MGEWFESLLAVGERDADQLFKHKVVNFTFEAAAGAAADSSPSFAKTIEHFNRKELGA